MIAQVETCYSNDVVQVQKKLHKSKFNWGPNPNPLSTTPLGEHYHPLQTLYNNLMLSPLPVSAMIPTPTVHAFELV